VTHINKEIDRLDVQMQDRAISMEEACSELCARFDAKSLARYIFEQLDYPDDKRDLEESFENDYDNYAELKADMDIFKQEHQDWVFISADRPSGLRKGWIAYDPNNDANAKEWTIRLTNLKKG
jgi:hypothetical protein